MQLLAETAASELDVVDSAVASERIGRVLDTLSSIETWNGLFYRWYRTGDGSIDRGFDGAYVSTVDNGWLAAGLVVASRAFPERADLAAELFERMDFSRLYDPSVANPFVEDDERAPGQFHGGYDPETGLTDWHYGVFNTEPRVASYLAIGKGDVPRAHWWGLFRTFAPEADTNQRPEGTTRTYDGVPVWEGHYEHGGSTFVPSWGGSMFESLMPSLVLEEKELGTQALGKNARRHARLHVAHAADRGYDAWGFSPCATPGGYETFGVDETGISGYGADAFVTPHATLLALEFVPDEAIRDALGTYRAWGMETEYGLYDSVRASDGSPTTAWLALDQAMSLVAIANRLLDGRVRALLADDPVGAGPADLLARERFTWGD